MFQRSVFSMPLGEWHTRSFLIELKPRADFASLFIDCPVVDGENVENDASARLVALLREAFGGN